MQLSFTELRSLSRKLKLDDLDLRDFLKKHTIIDFDKQYLSGNGDGFAALCKSDQSEYKTRELNIIEVLSANDASILYLSEKSLRRISLYDLSYITNKLESSGLHQVETIAKDTQQISTPDFLPLDFEKEQYANLPANFYLARVESANAPKLPVDYRSLTWESGTIEELIYNIVDYYEPCILTDIAEDLLQLFIDSNETSSATDNYSLKFLADLFLYISKDDFLKVKVPASEYILNTKLDHSKVRVLSNSSKHPFATTKMKNGSILCPSEWRIPIGSLRLFKRTEKILLSYGINNCCWFYNKSMRDICTMAPSLGAKCQEDLTRALTQKGLYIKKDD